MPAVITCRRHGIDYLVVEFPADSGPYCPECRKERGLTGGHYVSRSGEIKAARSVSRQEEEVADGM